MTVRLIRDDNGKDFYEAYACVWYGEDKKLRVQKKKKAPTEALAKKYELQLLRECEREAGAAEHHGTSWGNLIDTWEKYLRSGVETNLGKCSKQDYVAVLRGFTSHWNLISATSVTPHDLKTVIAEMTASGLSNSRKKYLMSAINNMFKWAVDTRKIGRDSVSPTYGIKVSKKSENKPEILTLEEIRKFLDAAKSMKHEWYPIWTMAFLTGMRSGELYALLWTDIDWDNRMLTVSKSYNKRESNIKCTKGGYWRDVPINDELMKLLVYLKANCHLRRRGPEYVLPRNSMWDRGDGAAVTRTFLKGIGLKDVKFHTLRACFATQLLRNGVPAAMVMRICGWTELKTMQHYVRLAGIEIKGATDCLSFETPEETMGKVVELFGRGGA